MPSVRSLVTLFYVSILTAACSAAPMVMAPSKSIVIKNKISGSLARVRVEQPASATYGDPALSAIAMSTWKNEVEAACDSSRLFDESSGTQIEIIIAVQRFEPSIWAYDHYADAKYRLIDKRTGATLKEIEVSSIGHDSTFEGAARSRNALSKSVSLNIEGFLKSFDKE